MEVNEYRDKEGRGSEGKTSDLCSVGAFVSKVLKRASQSGGGGFDAEGLGDALGWAELEAATANLAGLHQGGGRL